MSKGGNIQFWKEVLQAPQHVLDWIASEYKLPLRYLPEPFSRENHKSTLTHSKFVTESVTELLANRCVTKVAKKPYVCSPLSVVRWLVYLENSGAKEA